MFTHTQISYCTLRATDGAPLVWHCSADVVVSPTPRYSATAVDQARRLAPPPAPLQNSNYLTPPSPRKRKFWIPDFWVGSTA